MSEKISMPVLEIKLRTQKDMLQAVIDSQPKGPTSEQKKQLNQLTSKYKSVYAYNRADTDKETLVRLIKSSCLLTKAIMKADRWVYQGPSVSMDAKIKIWVTPDVKSVFIESLVNRLTAAARNTWNLVVFVKFIIVGDDGLLIEEEDDG